MKLFKNLSISGVVGGMTLVGALALSGCEQDYSIKSASTSTPSLNKTGSGSDGTASTTATPSLVAVNPNPPLPVIPPQVVNPVTVIPPQVIPPQVVPPQVVPPFAINPPVNVVPSPSEGPTAAAKEMFNAGSSQVKKIDFLFVVDNSKSMETSQKKLALGFRSFANTFFRRADLDICTKVITSDRRDGKIGKRGYERERDLPCTKPAGSENWSEAEMKSHVDSLIEQFETATRVGTKGNPIELLGKSLVSFLYGDSEWGAKDGEISTFFRKDAVANISFISDENNYYFMGEDMDESENDLPYMSGIPIPRSKTGAVDNRKGIKEYLDGYFAQVNPGKAPTYSVTSILEQNTPSYVVPGLSLNLSSLVPAIGRESKQSNIIGSVNDYTDVYQSIADALVLRASSFTLAHAVKSELIVKLVHTSGPAEVLNPKTQFALQNENLITLDPSVTSLLRDGDQVEVDYRYLVK